MVLDKTLESPLDCKDIITINGEGNGNPLQWSCLENPRDEGAWWAAIYGVAQGRPQLNHLAAALFSIRALSTVIIVILISCFDNFTIPAISESVLCLCDCVAVLFA